jgi:hypothetical protein
MPAVSVGSEIRVLPPFGDGATIFCVVAVQYVDSDGAISPEPTDSQQFVLSDGIAYAAHHLITTTGS